MGGFGKTLSSIFGVLVTIGVFKGINQSDATADGVAGVATSIIDGVADLTIRLIPTLIDFVNGIA